MSAAFVQFITGYEDQKISEMEIISRKISAWNNWFMVTENVVAKIKFISETYL